MKTRKLISLVLAVICFCSLFVITPNTAQAAAIATPQVDAGLYHLIALRDDGTVWAWGKNMNGQLGDGTTVNNPMPTQVSGLGHIISISAGESHTLALKDDGTVWAWGGNYFGQIGDGTTTDRLGPVQVLSDATAISASGSHSLAIKEDGTVWAWGRNAEGELGDGTTVMRTSPYRYR